MTPEVVAGIVAAVAAIAVAALAFRGSKTSAQPSAQSALNDGYKTLLAELRAEVDGLKVTVKDQGDKIDLIDSAHAETRERLATAQRVIGAAVGFIDRLVDWGRNGGQGDRPRPPKELHEFLDADDWDLHTTDPGDLRPGELRSGHA